MKNKLRQILHPVRYFKELIKKIANQILSYLALNVVTSQVTMITTQVFLI